MTRLLIGLGDGLFGFGTEARAAPQLLFAGVQPTALAVDPAHPARVYCATYTRGLWRSEDAGESWLPIGTPQDMHRRSMPGAIGPGETTFVSVAPVPGVDGQHAVWVGTEPSRLYRSTDLGETFELVSALALPSRGTWSFPPRPTTHHVQWIAHGDGGRVYVAIEAGATLRSLDDGQTFEDRRPDSPLDTHVLLTHPAAPGRLYAALGDALLGRGRGRSFAESRDGGERWQYSGCGLEATPYLYSLAINPGDPNDVRVAASPDPYSAHFTGGASIFRRQGEVWTEDAEGFPRGHSLMPVLAADPGQPGRWFALSNLGLFTKEPGASAWTVLAAPDDWRGRHPMTLAVLQG